MREPELPGRGRPRHLQIGQVAAATGLSARTIRYYESVGVVVPSGRSSGGFRLYTDDDVERLRLVTGMRPMGFSLEEIKDVLDLLDAAGRVDQGQATRERLQGYATLAVERSGAYARAVGMSLAFVAVLKAIVEAGPPS